MGGGKAGCGGGCWEGGGSCQGVGGIAVVQVGCSRAGGYHYCSLHAFFFFLSLQTAGWKFGFRVFCVSRENFLVRFFSFPCAFFFILSVDECAVPNVFCLLLFCYFVSVWGFLVSHRAHIQNASSCDLYSCYLSSSLKVRFSNCFSL